jgi:exodeoxyribonuclease VII large subunit
MHLSRALLQKQNEDLLRKQQNLQRELANQLEKKKDQLEMLEKRSELVDPRNILKRGYSITLMDGKSLLSVKNIKPGSILETRLHHGKIISKVEHSFKDNDKRED